MSFKNGYFKPLCVILVFLFSLCLPIGCKRVPKPSELYGVWYCETFSHVDAFTIKDNGEFVFGELFSDFNQKTKIKSLNFEEEIKVSEIFTGACSGYTGQWNFNVKSGCAGINIEYTPDGKKARLEVGLDFLLSMEMMLCFFILVILICGY